MIIFSFTPPPLDNHTVKNIERAKITTVTLGEEDREYDREIHNKPKSSSFHTPIEESGDVPNQKTPHNEFLAFPLRDIASKRSYIHKWGKDANKNIEWDIMTMGQLPWLIISQWIKYSLVMTPTSETYSLEIYSNSSRDMASCSENICEMKRPRVVKLTLMRTCSFMVRTLPTLTGRRGRHIPC
jgi:hypothetical protein